MSTLHAQVRSPKTESSPSVSPGSSDESLPLTVSKRRVMPVSPGKMSVTAPDPVDISILSGASSTDRRKVPLVEPISTVSILCAVTDTLPETVLTHSSLNAPSTSAVTAPDVVSKSALSVIVHPVASRSPDTALRFSFRFSFSISRIAEFACRYRLAPCHRKIVLTYRRGSLRIVRNVPVPLPRSMTLGGKPRPKKAYV